MLKKANINYYLVENQLHNNDVDFKLDNFKSEYGFENEKIYLMDINKYPNNSGVFNIKRRYKDFMNDICAPCGDSLPLGPNLYVYFKEGEFVKYKYTRELKNEDIAIYKD